MTHNVSRLPKEARGLLGPYFPGFNLTRIRIQEGIPWYVVGRPRGYADRNKIYLAHGEFRIDTIEGMSLLAHEIVHCRQYEMFGVWNFRARYIGDYLMNLRRGMSLDEAYLNIPFEVEARMIECQVFSEISRLSAETLDRLKKLMI